MANNNKLIVLGFVLVTVLLLAVGLKGQSVTGAAVAGQRPVVESLFASNADSVFGGEASGASSSGSNWIAVEQAMSANVAIFENDLDNCLGNSVCEHMAITSFDQRTAQLEAEFAISMFSGDFDMVRALSTAEDTSSGSKVTREVINSYMDTFEEIAPEFRDVDADGIGDAEEVGGVEEDLGYKTYEHYIEGPDKSEYVLSYHYYLGEKHSQYFPVDSTPDSRYEHHVSSKYVLVGEPSVVTKHYFKTSKDYPFLHYTAGPYHSKFDSPVGDPFPLYDHVKIGDQPSYVVPYDWKHYYNGPLKSLMGEGTTRYHFVTGPDESTYGAGNALHGSEAGDDYSKYFPEGYKHASEFSPETSKYLDPETTAHLKDGIRASSYVDILFAAGTTGAYHVIASSEIIYDGVRKGRGYGVKEPKHATEEGPDKSKHVPKGYKHATAGTGSYKSKYVPPDSKHVAEGGNFPSNYYP